MTDRRQFVCACGGRAFEVFLKNTDELFLQCEGCGTVSEVLTYEYDKPWMTDSVALEAVPE